MNEMEKAYEPAKYEADIYQAWEKSGAFQPGGNPEKPHFSIVMPPPNANGSLHAGHAMYTVEDLITRYMRMQQRPTLWLPGTDHAGIESQFVYERDILGPKGQTRFDLGQERFYNELLEFTHSSGGKVIDQFRSLGMSADWSKQKFTLDEDVVAMVYDTFKDLHSDGLIYRGNRIVNWCTRCNAAFADVEVKHVERTDEIYTLDYGSVQIATTRPETIFADTAVAVNPEDVRYRKLIGKTATVPLVNRPVPVIADNHVDPQFGSGALKVTPGHDPNDYEIGLRHNLPQLTVIDQDGRMVNVPEELAGLEAAEARTRTVEWLEREGKLLGRKALTHAVGTHDRCGTVIEPLITEQWFLRIKPLAEAAVSAVRSGEVHVHPERFEKILIAWLENLHDWNISRQIWWGIRIPVFYKTSNDPEKQPYIVATSEQEALDYYGHGNYRAENDTFDTWFSSSQWPVITTKTTDTFDGFYPTSFMGTARDILSKWVATMLMMGLYRTGKVPFKDVYLWGMVNDEHGKKMSKSKGNGINPLDLTAKYGTDALRMALTIGITAGNDGSISDKKVEGYRNFCNKLWNIARFVSSQNRSDYTFSRENPAVANTSMNLADRWILNKFSRENKAIGESVEAYRFSEAGERLYGLVWSDFADWYIEASKLHPNPAVLNYCLDVTLRMAHPFAPYVTEAIWGHLGGKGQLITAEWPDVVMPQENADDFEVVRNIVGGVRTLSTELGLQKPVLLVRHGQLSQESLDLIAHLAHLGGVEIGEGSGLRIPAITADIWLKADDEVIKGHQDRLLRRRSETKAYVARLDKQLQNEGYLKSAPRPVVAQTRRRLEDAKLLLSKLDEQLKAIPD